ATRTVTETGPATTAAQTAVAAPAVVLGSKGFGGPNAEGRGTMQPARIYNGGDRSGLVTDIHWNNWGQSEAIGTGQHAIFKPGGGYYEQPVTTHLRAYDIGTATRVEPPA